MPEEGSGQGWESSRPHGLLPLVRLRGSVSGHSHLPNDNAPGFGGRGPASPSPTLPLSSSLLSAPLTEASLCPRHRLIGLSQPTPRCVRWILPKNKGGNSGPERGVGLERRSTSLPHPAPTHILPVLRPRSEPRPAGSHVAPT